MAIKKMLSKVKYTYPNQWIDLRYNPSLCMGRLKKTGNPVWIASPWVDIQTRYLSNMRHNCCDSTATFVTEIMLKSFSCSNENRTEVIDHIKCSMVNLLCSLSGVASSDAKEVSSAINGNAFTHAILWASCLLI